VDLPEPNAPAPAPAGGRLTGFEAAKVHITLVLVLALCISAFLFEVRRALGGNELSWAYVFEWPMFALFALYMWWTTLHGGRKKKSATALATPKVVAPEHVEMLKNWQAHQRSLATAEAEAQRATAEAQGADPEAGRRP
jgi:hypothetical protein